MHNLNSSFLEYLLKQYDKLDLENINNCKNLSYLFKKFNDLINSLYKYINKKQN